MNWIKTIATQSLLGLALLSTILSGCSGSQTQTHPVRGLVRFTDGKLLRNGTVEFELMDKSNSVTATAEILPDGTFLLGTYKIDDGALAGKYRAVVISDVEIGNGVERPGLIAQSKLHPKYRDFRTAGLRFEVKPGTNNFIVEVEYVPESDADDENTKR